MINLLDFIFRDFWTWCGAMSLLYILVRYVVKILNSIMWHTTVRRVGYPPSPHFNIEGTYGPIKEKEDVQKINE
jgi:hypothetical protein